MQRKRANVCPVRTCYSVSRRRREEERIRGERPPWSFVLTLGAILRVSKRKNTKIKINNETTNERRGVHAYPGENPIITFKLFKRKPRVVRARY